MKLQQVSDNCFAVLNEKNRVCDANSGLINLGGGVVIDTQSDLPHARRMIELFGKVWPGMPRRVVNTHEDGAHVWGNQLFEGAEIIAHRTVPGRMRQAADPRVLQKLLDDASRLGERSAAAFREGDAGIVMIGIATPDQGADLLMKRAAKTSKKQVDADAKDIKQAIDEAAAS